MATFDIWLIGETYVSAKPHNFSISEQATIREFIECQWHADIAANGVNVQIVDFQPYRSAKEMRALLQATGKLLISTQGNVADGDGHPLTPELNLKHRAVHDYHHCILSAGFNAPGEITASAHMIKLARQAGYPVFVQQFLFGEMIGQTGYFYVTEGRYADQKVVLFQPELIDELIELYEELGTARLIAYLTLIDKAARKRNGWKARSAH